MNGDVLRRDLEELGDLRLGKPYRAVNGSKLDLRQAIGCPIQNDLAFGHAANP